jgi:hypothetical protein
MVAKHNIDIHDSEENKKRIKCNVRGTRTICIGACSTAQQVQICIGACSTAQQLQIKGSTQSYQ